jgi:hypothetical protein
MNKSGVVLIATGVLLLAHNFGLIDLSWLRQWWPLILIGIGVWSTVRRKPGDNAPYEDKFKP